MQKVAGWELSGCDFANGVIYLSPSGNSKIGQADSQFSETGTGVHGVFELILNTVRTRMSVRRTSFFAAVAAQWTAADVPAERRNVARLLESILAVSTGRVTVNSVPTLI